MARSVLQRTSDALVGLAGLRDDGGARPAPAMPSFRSPPVWTEEAQRAREDAEAAHASRNPGGGVCPCGCRRFESARINGALTWVCGGCRKEYEPRGAGPLVREAPPPLPTPQPLPSPAEAREARTAAVDAREAAKAAHAGLAHAADGARSAVSQAEQMAEVAAAALTEARVAAREAAAWALQAGRPAPAPDLRKSAARWKRPLTPSWRPRKPGNRSTRSWRTPARRWRHVKVTEHRAARDFAFCMRDLADIHYPNAELIRVVMDNLSTHNPGALYETFPASEAHRILQRLEFHYTPKHASWLNMVEIEIGVLRGQCLDRRIGERETLIAEIEAWLRQRNASGARIKWKFTTQKARHKLARAYPDTAKES
jgi:hypothetical protein